MNKIKLENHGYDYHSLGLVYLDSGMYKESIEMLKQAITLSEYVFEAYHYHLSISYSKIGKFNEAIEELKKAKKGNRKYRPAYFYLAIIYSIISQEEKAFGEYNKLQIIDEQLAKELFDIINDPIKLETLNPLEDLYSYVIGDQLISGQVRKDSIFAKRQPEVGWASEAPKVILLVEYDPNMTLILIEGFEEYFGNRVKIVSFKDGTPAFEFFKNNSDKVDLIISCLVLPILDGIKLLRLCKELNYKIPYIIHSAQDYSEDYATWPSDAYIVKSADLTKLLETTNRLLSIEL